MNTSRKSKLEKNFKLQMLNNSLKHEKRILRDELKQVGMKLMRMDEQNHINIGEMEQKLSGSGVDTKQRKLAIGALKNAAMTQKRTISQL
eukprot:CAMPEP_0171295078 /NCGR_PEP_ID=MMETSP0816-20121228/3678_1 /TAXON_ID=420281 /ORGANISM="Proboscia inermis, Strain CCAP1064/1" /LENGTH=89 /DNA_ID=CAMNT_0011767483 /DNA_START=493 /DNA_END=762 /DNA_ORIENTATION=+